MTEHIRNGLNRVIHPWANHRISLYNLENGANTTITLGTGKKTKQVVNGKHKKVVEHPLKKVELRGDGKLEAFVVEGLAAKVESKARKSMITDILDPNLRNLLKEMKDKNVGRGYNFPNGSISIFKSAPIGRKLPEHIQSVILSARMFEEELRKPQSFKEQSGNCCLQTIGALYDTRNEEFLEDSIHEHIRFFPNTKPHNGYPKENMVTVTKDKKEILEPLDEHESHRHFATNPKK